MNTKHETKKALAAKAADAKKVVALKAAGLSANATAAEVVRLFKSTAADVEKSTREGMRKLAELAALLVEGYGLTQEQVAEQVGRSQPWVSGVLRWRRDGYKEVAFGPETRSAPKLLAANNNSADTCTRTAGSAEIRTVAGDKLDLSILGARAAEQLAKHMAGNDVDNEASANAVKARFDPASKPIEAVVEPQPEPSPEPPRPELTAEEKSDEALTAWKMYTAEAYKVMTDADQKAGKSWLYRDEWKPRSERKKAA